MIVRGTEGGQSWAELADLDSLASVLDPADSRGGKNRLIDRVHKCALGRAAGDLRRSRVLDFGSGTGRLSEWLVERGAQVEGVDITAEMVQVARRRVPRARFQSIEGSALPFGDRDFDLVVTAYVLQYYVDAGVALARELARTLKGGGQLIAIEQATEENIGRGGTVAAYERMLAVGDFRLLGIFPIRLSDSPLVAAAQKIPSLARLPFAAQLVIKDATKRTNVRLTDGRYADVLIHAVKEND